jgi:hypothetical protein
MTDGTTTVTIPGDAPTAVELLLAVRGGDIDLVRRLLSENPDLARARFEARGGTCTALHFVTDWPGYFPNGPDTKRYEMADVLKDFDPDDLTFDVNLGFDDGFIGLDGADKSTTMRLILAS